VLRNETKLRSNLKLIKRLPNQTRRFLQIKPVNKKVKNAPSPACLPINTDKAILLNPSAGKMLTAFKKL